jgi:hypothetical protein
MSRAHGSPGAPHFRNDSKIGVSHGGMIQSPREPWQVFDSFEARFRNARVYVVKIPRMTLQPCDSNNKLFRELTTSGDFENVFA